MKKKEAIGQMDKRFKKIKTPVKAFIKSGDQEALHQFRIEVKKLKAMLILYSAETKNQDLLNNFKPIKTVFKKAGEIRNAHINLKLAEKYRLGDAGFKQHQQKILNEGSETFKHAGKKYLKAVKKAQVALQLDLHRLHNKEMVGFYKDKLLQLEAFFAGIAFDEQLHNARKNIKLLLYNQRSAEKAIANKLDLDYRYLDDLQQNIGDWHDHNLTVEMLSQMEDDESTAITAIKNSNSELEQNILELARNFKNKVSLEKEIQY